MKQIRARYPTLAILATGVLVLVTGIRVASVSDNPAVIRGPLALLLPSSTDLGPSRGPQRAAYRHAAATRDALKHVGDYLTNT